MAASCHEPLTNLIAVIRSYSARQDTTEAITTSSLAHAASAHIARTKTGVSDCSWICPTRPQLALHTGG